MNAGINLVDLAKELERQIETRKDYVSKTSAITMVAGAFTTEPRLTVGTEQAMEITSLAHDQLAQYVGIPRPYYDRMQAERADLLATNVNTWLRAKGADDKRLVRTLEKRVRALLSDSYRPLDNYDLASAVVPIFKDRGVKVISNGLTETRMYIKGILPDLSIGLDKLGLGEASEAYVAAVTIGNSELGAGSLTVEAGFYVTKCRNLAVFKGSGMRKHHVGRAFGDLDGDFTEFFKDDTRAQDDKALWLKVRDVVAAALSEDVFKQRAQMVAASHDDKIASPDLPAVVEVTLKRYGLPEALSARVQSTIEDKYDLTRYGLSAALTEVSGRLKDYALSTQLESVGGEIITLDPSQWKVISESVAVDKPKRASRAKAGAR